MRLIDAEALTKKAVMAEALDGSGVPYEFLVVPLVTLETAPTIEAKPIVHAHVIEHQGYEDEYYCECSNCHTHEVWVECKYCSECGAQMDEKEGE